MTNKKKICFGVLSSLLLSAGVLTSCGGGGSPTGGKYKVLVWNFKGGFGGDWIENVIEEYEALHANTKYGDKTGVKFEVTNNKKEFVASELVTYDMFFLESANYMDFVANNAVEDITDAVTSDNPYEPGKTLLSKFTESQKSFYKTQGDKYFGVPHYSGTYGFTYDAKLFKQNGYYYKKGHNPVETETKIGNLFTDDLSNLANGPDGVAGTSDDGLPETFNEFYKLCERIKMDEIAPMVFTGDSNKGGYISAFATSLVNNLMGLDQAMINYSFNGTATKLAKVKTEGGVSVIETDANGNAVLEDEPVVITEANGYDIFRSEAKFNASKFVANIFQNKRYNSHCDDDLSYTGAQDEFIMGEKLGKEPSINHSAMFIDGSWWESEAKDTFKQMDETYPGQGQGVMDRDFRFMPFPKAKADDEYHQTYTDTLNALQCVRKGVDPTAKAICMDFLQFINTDAQLVKFSQTTNTTRALNYSMTDTELEKLSPYGRSLFKYKNDAKTEIIYPISASSKFINGMSAYFTSQYLFQSKDKKALTSWFELSTPVYDASKIVGGIYDYYKETFPRL